MDGNRFLDNLKDDFRRGALAQRNALSAEARADAARAAADKAASEETIASKRAKEAELERATAAANAREAVDAEVMPEHMTAKATMNVTK